MTNTQEEGALFTMGEQAIQALFAAIEANDTATVSSILSSEPEAAQHWRFESPCTPLHAAIKSPEILALLISQGAEPNAIDSDEQMTSPLQLCVAQGLTESAKVLVSNGADPNAHSCWGTPLHCVLGSIDGATPDNVPEMLEFLLEAGADINASMNPKTDVWTPLHQAASEGVVDGLTVLLDRGAKVFLQKDGLTALRVAQSMGFSEIETILRRFGAS
jgi:ankyrin repeat protein